MEFLEPFRVMIEGIGPTNAILLLGLAGWLYFRQYVKHHDQVHDRLGTRLKEMRERIDTIYELLITKDKDKS